MAWFTCPAIRRAACLATRRSFVLGSLRYYATRGPSSQRGHYDVLGVSLTATQDDIKVAFRQRAKELHPDVSGHSISVDDFLQLVAAYEVLSDPEQRQLYDVSRDQQLPNFMRQAAQATAKAADIHSSQSGINDDAGWRYGMSDWARSGPSINQNTPARADQIFSVLGALRRYKDTLEEELHAALMHAYLGPKLNYVPGHLPAAFEAEERSDVSMSHDLLHLVFGRTLLGSVRLRQELMLEGDANQQQQLSSASQSKPCLPSANTTEPAGVQPAAAADDAAAACQGTAAGPLNDSCNEHATVGDNLSEELSEEEWEQRLEELHRLRGCYDWAGEDSSLLAWGIQGDKHLSHLHNLLDSPDASMQGLSHTGISLSHENAMIAADSSNTPDAVVRHQTFMFVCKHDGLGSTKAREQWLQSIKHLECQAQLRHVQQQMQHMQQSQCPSGNMQHEHHQQQQHMQAYQRHMPQNQQLLDQHMQQQIHAQNVHMQSSGWDYTYLQQQHQHHLQWQSQSQREWQHQVSFDNSDTTQQHQQQRQSTQYSYQTWQRLDQQHVNSTAAGAQPAHLHQEHNHSQQDQTNLQPSQKQQQQHQLHASQCQQCADANASGDTPTLHHMQPQHNHPTAAYEQLRQQQQQVSAQHSTADTAVGSAPCPPGLLDTVLDGLGHGLHEAVQGLAGRKTLPELDSSGSSDSQTLSSASGNDTGVESRHTEQHRPQQTHAAGNRASSQRRQRSRKGSFQKLFNPTADWQAADWGFSDADEHVTVMEMVMDHKVVAVAVRAEHQDNRPIKVYHQGKFIAAVLDDVVMQPHTGAMLAVIYKTWTPGVHHMWFYRPQQPVHRLLCRLRRAWMPPSSTWLFPPRDRQHDVGGWYVEWEGHRSQHKPGWIHPSVYVLTSALISHDMEQARLARAQQRQWFWQKSGLARLADWWKQKTGDGSGLDSAAAQP